MSFPIIPLASSTPAARLTRRIRLRLAGWLGGVIAGSVLIPTALAQGPSAPPAKDEFSSLVKLAPFVVSGKSLAISVYARTRADRRYGEEFSEAVVKVVYEAVTESTGKGLVIIGAKGEPHPHFVFEKFAALAKDGKLDPEVAARAPEVAAMLDRWERTSNDRNSVKSDKDNENELEVDFAKIFPALPLPLAGIGAKLFRLAWEEKFDQAKVDARLRALRPDDLERRDLFESFDWVFYLPPKGAFDRVLDEVIAAAIKQEKMGFFARTTVKGVLLVVKPKLRRAIEAMRQGMMFTTVVQAQTKYSEDEVSALTDAYTEVFIPFDSQGPKPPGRTDHERAVNAVREQLQKNTEKLRPSSDLAASAAAKPVPELARP